MIIILGILLILALAYIGFLIYNLYDITRQLNYIVQNDTNAELVSTSKNFLIRRLLDANNQLIQKNKKVYQNHWTNEKQFHQSLSNLSHDLKTPLTVSSGYVQLLLKKQNEPSTQEILKKTEAGLLTIENYLHYLMEYTLIHEKQLQMDFEMVNFTQLLQEEAFLYYENFSAKEIELSFDLEENLVLISDMTVLKRVFQNLLGNILKHGQTAAHFEGKRKGDRIIFVARNQVAQAIDDQENLLNRFVTNDQSRQNKSTGLGLSIIKELVELLDGEIHLESEGTTFQVNIVLPIRSTSHTNN
ncbi:hypothetical protein BAU15_11520 [Enterococcus sp. JM4C]|uniref:sensor histidine kinase n=1 Tax=Candidatus Enterococcus huntleyi TaxID=1857217 RepID=UPI00137B5A89|nr:HAMP domain-containing sensor histidine kinase [Enterococcus sp. JM4C]KAF1297372.1 hypothetical protein BAU15_11520 [Enterococcus sp. JM4C]